MRRSGVSFANKNKYKSRCPFNGAVSSCIRSHRVRDPKKSGAKESCLTHRNESRLVLNSAVLCGLVSRVRDTGEIGADESCLAHK